MCFHTKIHICAETHHLLNPPQTSSHCVKEFIWGQLEITPQSDTLLSSDRCIRSEIGTSPAYLRDLIKIWNQEMPVISKESMNQKVEICLKFGERARRILPAQIRSSESLQSQRCPRSQFQKPDPWMERRKAEKRYSRMVHKTNKAQTTNQVVKIILQSGLHLQRRACTCIVLTGLQGNVARILQPALSLMRLTLWYLSVFLFVLQCQLLHTTSQNYVSCSKNTIGTQDG